MEKYSDDFIYKVASLCDSAIKKYKFIIGEAVTKDSLSTMGEFKRTGIIDAVKYILNNELVTPNEIHEMWVKYYRQGGWVYGEFIDYEKKEHPGLVPYDELSENDKFKDMIFINTVLTVKNYVEMNKE